MFAVNEIWNGNAIHRRISPLSVVVVTASGLIRPQATSGFVGDGALYGLSPITQYLKNHRLSRAKSVVGM
jgi:hypothetical protein